MDYDEAGVEMQFKSAAAISVTYTLLERCGYEPTGWFDKDDFRQSTISQPRTLSTHSVPQSATSAAKSCAP